MRSGYSWEEVGEMQFTIKMKALTALIKAVWLHTGIDVLRAPSLSDTLDYYAKEWDALFDRNGNLLHYVPLAKKVS